jgi:hypothetical protein
MNYPVQVTDVCGEIYYRIPLHRTIYVHQSELTAEKCPLYYKEEQVEQLGEFLIRIKGMPYSRWEDLGLDIPPKWDYGLV